jgi:hypothetical protein
LAATSSLALGTLTTDDLGIAAHRSFQLPGVQRQPMMQIIASVQLIGLIISSGGRLASLSLTL